MHQHTGEFPMIVVGHLDAINIGTPLRSRPVEIGRIAIDQPIVMIDLGDRDVGWLADDLDPTQPVDDLRQ
jgi:hypothetical protein